MVFALRDPIGGNLDRIQIIKGWYDGKKQHEKVYDVAWSGDRKPGKDGKVAGQWATQWTPKPPPGPTPLVPRNWAPCGPTRNSTRKQRAFYYARVLEIPTPRWSTYDAFRFGVDIPDGAPASTQDRAYTSPIWYTPE